MHEQEPEKVQEEQDEAHSPRIWIASLSDYNAGVLHGEWIAANQSPELLHQAAAAILANSPTDPAAEEWAVFDYDNFGRIRLGEYESAETISRLAAALAEHGAAYGGWAALVGLEYADAEAFTTAYLGRWESVVAFADQLFEDLGVHEVLATNLPGGLRPYARLDVEGFARDLQLGGELSAVEADGYGVWLFDMRG
jgi:antirestriction protein